MFSIDASTGTLTAVSGSPFPQGGTPDAGIADVDISCKSELLFGTLANFSNTQVSVATIAPNGVLTQIAGSPFTFGPGANSNVGVLSPDNRHLFVSNQYSNTITSLDVASGGSLTQETGSPFNNPGGLFPSGMGTNREGTLLYVANFNEVVTGFHIDGDGSLIPLTPVNAFATGVPGPGLRNLIVFPAKPIEGEGKMKDDKGRENDFSFEADRECEARGEMEFEERDTGEKMHGSMDNVSVTGDMAAMSGRGTLADGTPVQYTAIVVGNAPVVGLNQFAISWITATGSIFQTSGALTEGYVVVHPQ
jgi:hypothetical protein